MSFRFMAHRLLLFVVGAFALGIASEALAECSDSRIKQLSKQGKTVAAIAKSCKMSKADVKSALEDDEDDDDDDGGSSGGTGGSTGGGGLPKGAPVGQCGCWGPVSPGYVQAHPSCKSGTARAQSCGQMCPLGGSAWRGVCT
jgi:hypothetical protein